MKKIINALFVVLGMLCIGIGLLGVILPVLPTTPFLILAAACLAKGSDRFHTWFVHTKLYEKHIDSMVTKKEMTREAKRNILVTVTIVFTIGIYFSPVFAKIIIVCVAIFHYYYFLYRIKTVIPVEQKREEEKESMKHMVQIYCRGNHKTKKGELCEECKELLAYANLRTEKCPFMETKTFCYACKVHCYKPDMKERVKKVMRYSGPRMLFSHPIQSIRHLNVTVQTKRESKKG